MGSSAGAQQPYQSGSGQAPSPTQTGAAALLANAPGATALDPNAAAAQKQLQGQSKKSAGSAPNYQDAAQQQAQSSQQNVSAQTLQNRPDISTPFSTQTWTTGPDGRPVLSQGLSGGLGTASASLSGQAGQSLANPLDSSLFGPVQTGDQARDQAITGAYNQATSRLNPQFAQQRQLLSSQLAGQGLDPNSQAYRNAMQQFGQQENDAYSSAMNNAIGQGTAAGQATFNENLAAQQQNIANALRQRETPLAELGQLQGLSSQQPSFNAAGVADTTQYLPASIATGNYNLQNQEQQNQVLGDLLGGLLGAGGTVAGAAIKSDERAKTDVHRLGIEAEPGVPFATFAYKEKPKQKYLGVIAQDVERVAPERVKRGADGFKYVKGAPFAAL